MKKIQKVIAIGDSFLAGAELGSPNLTWPALFARDLNLDYQCLARSGHSIQFVLRNLLESLHKETVPCFYVLHWPSALRFEYVNRQNDTWVQINPNSILFGNDRSEIVKKIYYQDVNSLLGDKWKALSTIFSAILALKQTSHSYAMSTVDNFLFDTEFHNPLYIEYLQNQCRSEIKDFEGLPFHFWAAKNNFLIGPNGHPLEQAHQAAFEITKPLYQQIINISNIESLP